MISVRFIVNPLAVAISCLSLSLPYALAQSDEATTATPTESPLPALFKLNVVDMIYTAKA